MNTVPEIPSCNSNQCILHVLTNKGFICGSMETAEGYYFLEDIVENGYEAVQYAAGVHYRDISMCPNCWNPETVAIHILGQI